MANRSGRIDRIKLDSAPINAGGVGTTNATEATASLSQPKSRGYAVSGFEILTVFVAFCAIVVSVWSATTARKADRKANKAAKEANKLTETANNLTSQGNDVQARLLGLEKERVDRERRQDLDARAHQYRIAEAATIAEFEFTLTSDAVLISNRGQGDAKKVEWVVTTASGHDVTIGGVPASRDLIRAGETWTYDIALSMGTGDVLITIAWDDGRAERHARGPIVLVDGNTV